MIQCSLIQFLRDLIGDPAFVARHRRSEADFTRHRTLSFPIVVVFLLNLIKGALQRELDQFFQVLSPGDVAERVVTKSAFCAARQKLNPTAFIELNRHLAGTTMLRFGGGAGSTCAPSMDRRCGCPTRQRRSPRSARCFPPTRIPPPGRGPPRSTTRSTASSLMLSSLPISRTSATFWSSILQP